MDLGPHATFIIAAYAIVSLVTIGLVGVTISNVFRQARRLERLEAERKTGA
ncbi:MAG: heme exporter protein CcmD [Hyphomicrobiaceae bacterium]|nr:heme exporter protein CcmD [Hyphomicrobiaceae bacterium]MCC0023778.1 heme exporter protein CcmD [Hyphomicrobiaceae bacterium]